jgi:hypothetical protein
MRQKFSAMRLNDFLKPLAIIFWDRLDFRAEALAMLGGCDAHGFEGSVQARDMA